MEPSHVRHRPPTSSVHSSSPSTSSVAVSAGAVVDDCSTLLLSSTSSHAPIVAPSDPLTSSLIERGAQRREHKADGVDHCEHSHSQLQQQRIHVALESSSGCSMQVPLSKLNPLSQTSISPSVLPAATLGDIARGSVSPGTAATDDLRQSADEELDDLSSSWHQIPSGSSFPLLSSSAAGSDWTETLDADRVLTPGLKDKLITLAHQNAALLTPSASSTGKAGSNDAPSSLDHDHPHHRHHHHPRGTDDDNEVDDGEGASTPTRASSIAPSGYNSPSRAMARLSVAPPATNFPTASISPGRSPAHLGHHTAPATSELADALWRHDASHEHWHPNSSTSSSSASSAAAAVAAAAISSSSAIATDPPSPNPAIVSRRSGPGWSVVEGGKELTQALASAGPSSLGFAGLGPSSAGGPLGHDSPASKGKGKHREELDEMDDDDPRSCFPSASHSRSHSLSLTDPRSAAQHRIDATRSLAASVGSLPPINQAAYLGNGSSARVGRPLAPIHISAVSGKSRSSSRAHSLLSSPMLLSKDSSLTHGAGLRGLDEDLHSSGQASANEVSQQTASESLESFSSASSGSVVLPSKTEVSLLQVSPPKKLCFRHQRMADEGMTAKLQKAIESIRPAHQASVNQVWSIFSNSSHSERALILQGILTMCCFSQLSLLSSELALAIRIDPFSLFPREISLRILGYLDAMSLGRAAQVSRLWKSLADDDLLWRNMCEQHIERKCEKCGWGLPLLNEKRRRQRPSGSQGPFQSLIAGRPQPAAQQASPAAVDASLSNGSLKRSITAAANAAALERHDRTSSISRTASLAGGAAASSSTLASVSGSYIEEDTNGMDIDTAAQISEDDRPSKRQCSSVARSDSTARESDGQGSSSLSSSQSLLPATSASSLLSQSAPSMTTRPWKWVYCERLAIERNWRKGRYTHRTLTGHTDGIMCLQFNESLAHPSFPVVITGSYDRTARIWNMETGEELRVLRGHTRGVRCLQFDEAKLITGSMDRTLKIWNWRTGALMRTLEGHNEGIVCLHFNDDLLASGSADAEIKVWNFRSGECFTLRGHTDWVNALVLWSGPTSSSTASIGDDPARSGSAGQRKGNKNAGKFLFSASDDGTIRLWDLELRECLLVYDGHVGQVQSIKLINMDEQAIYKLSRGAAGGPGADDADRDRFERLIRADESGLPRARSVERRQSQQQHHASSPGDRPASAVPSRSQTQPIPTGRSVHPGGPTTLGSAIPEHFYDFAADQNAGSAEARAHQRRRRRKVDPVLAKLQDRLCSAGLVDPLPLDAEMGDLDGCIFGGAGSAVAEGTLGSDEEFHDDTKSYGAGSAPGSSTSTAWLSSSADSSHSAHHLQSPSLDVPRGRTRRSTTAAVDTHRPVLISGSLDNTLKIWDVRTGRCLRTLFGHVEGVWALDVDKLRVISASHDRTIKIWDRESAQCQNTLVGHRGAVTCASLGDDKIVSGSDDGDVRVWSFAPNSM